MDNSLTNKIRIFVTVFLTLIVISSSWFSPVYSQSVTELEEQLKKQQEEKQAKEDYLKETENRINEINQSSLSIDQKIDEINKEIERVNNYINENLKSLDLQNELIARYEVKFSEDKSKAEGVSVNLYRNSFSNILDVVFSDDGFIKLIRSTTYKRFVITSQLEELKQLSESLKTLSDQKNQLEVTKAEFETQNKQLAGVITTLESEKWRIEQERLAQLALHGNLKSDIDAIASKISDLQKSIIAARSGGTITNIGEVPSTGDFNATAAGFRQNAPAGSFAVFSIGAYTHRRGMSQYGANARAAAGQSYLDIARHYFGSVPELVDTSGGIQVAGYGTLDFEGYYLYGIAEMPSSWQKEALKAQAVAARTYAYRYKVQGKEICVTERCQVFNKGKADNPPEAWKQAVDETKGMVIMNGVVMYSATSGGYLVDSGWDTTDGKGGADWTSKSWEKISGSPWFYKSWYRSSYSDYSSTCNRTAWLNEEEMADIINSWLALNRNEGKTTLDKNRIVPVTLGVCAISGVSAQTPYSMSELRDNLQNPITSISGQPVVLSDDKANTTSVIFQTNRGEIVIPGLEFKTVFNTRAPGYLAIPQSGFAFFNIERK